LSPQPEAKRGSCFVPHIALARPKKRYRKHNGTAASAFVLEALVVKPMSRAAL
jgi:hypothetical protein